MGRCKLASLQKHNALHFKQPRQQNETQMARFQCINILNLGLSITDLTISQLHQRMDRMVQKQGCATWEILLIGRATKG